MKRCSKCREVKSLDNFANDKYKKDGKFNQCKQCKKKNDHKHWKNNRDRLNAQCKKYKQEHKEQQREYDKKYKKDNLERNTKQSKELRLIYKSAWIQKFKECGQKMECVDCGETNFDLLEFDHIPGRGEKKIHLGHIIYNSLTPENWDRVEEELPKGEWRCYCCHKKIGAKRAGHYNTFLCQGYRPKWRVYIKEEYIYGCECYICKSEKDVQFHHDPVLMDKYGGEKILVSHLMQRAFNDKNKQLIMDAVVKTIPLCLIHHRLFHHVFGRKGFPSLFSPEVQEWIKEIQKNNLQSNL